MRTALRRARLRRLGAAATIGVAATIALPGIGRGVAAAATATNTPIQHLVVIFQENVSFDHYFGTYPYAANTDGHSWTNPADTTTPLVNGLYTSTSGGVPSGPLLSSNPNSSNPVRLDSTATGLNGGNPGGQLTCDQDHNYSDEQQAFDGGAMDQFVQSVGTSSGTAPGTTNPCTAKTAMDYYDGNTVTGIWNYARNYAMSDNSFGTTFGPSAPGAINLISGDTGNVDMGHTANSPSISSSSSPNADLTVDGTTTGGKPNYSLTSDAQPYWDDCSTRDAVAMNGHNIGDLLNAQGVSWGWFQGGFRPTTTFAAASAAVSPGQSTATFTPDEFSGSFTGKVVPAHASNQALCDAVTPVGVALSGTGQYGYKDDYIAHHEPFQYYATTANPHHLTVPTDSSGNDTLAGLQEIGTDTQTITGGDPQFNTPNHNYDTSDFDQLVSAVAHGTPGVDLPGVSFLKAPGFEDGHAGYSDPQDEQNFVAREINALMQTPDWKAGSLAVVINYDDSDGWYDHVTHTVVNSSESGADNLTNTTKGKISATNLTSGLCTTPNAANQGIPAPLAGEQGRCGLGPRLPMMVISPCAKSNYVDHALSDQSSVTKFIEGNWGVGPIPGSFTTLPYNQVAPTNSAYNAEGPLADMFAFSSCATPAVFIDPVTGAVTTMPVPLLPDSRLPVLFAVSGVVSIGGVVMFRRRRDRRPA